MSVTVTVTVGNGRWCVVRASYSAAPATEWVRVACAFMASWSRAALTATVRAVFQSVGAKVRVVICGVVSRSTCTPASSLVTVTVTRAVGCVARATV